MVCGIYFNKAIKKAKQKRERDAYVSPSVTRPERWSLNWESSAKLKHIEYKWQPSAVSIPRLLISNLSCPPLHPNMKYMLFLLKV